MQRATKFEFAPGIEKVEYYLLSKFGEVDQHYAHDQGSGDF